MPVFIASRVLGLAGSAALFFACARAPSVLKGKYPSGIPRYSVSLDSAGRKHGAENWWYDNGKPHLATEYRHGARHGGYQAWYPNGNPWYKGRDSLGIAQDTLRTWRADGTLESIRVFDAGRLTSIEIVGPDGLSRAHKQRLAFAAEVRHQDSAQIRDRARRAALGVWAQRVRATVETYWIPPKRSGMATHRTVARLRVGARGQILGVTWVEKSAWKAFNDKAAKALARVKKLPPLPEGAGTEPVELRYEFVSLGKKPAPLALRLRSPGSARSSEEVGEAEDRDAPADTAR
jgi:hypothetical protein